MKQTCFTFNFVPVIPIEVMNACTAKFNENIVNHATAISQGLYFFKFRCAAEILHKRVFLLQNDNRSFIRVLSSLMIF